MRRQHIEPRPAKRCGRQTVPNACDDQVFIRLLANDASARRAGGGDGWVSPNARRVANRWRKMVFMVSNPIVASYKSVREREAEGEAPGT